MQLYARDVTCMLAALSGCAFAPSPTDYDFSAFEDDGSAPQLPDAALEASADTASIDAGFTLAPDAFGPILDGGAGLAGGGTNLDATVAQTPDTTSSDAAPGPNDAAASSAEAGVDARAAIADSGAEAATAAPLCRPAACTSRCALLNRCCTADNQCACENPATRECDLPSL
jgi:hypothetical protein